MTIAIYGAKSIALGVCRAVQALYPEVEIRGFLVSSHKGNPRTLAGLPVRELGEFSRTASRVERQDTHILIATPEDLHAEIARTLEEHGYGKYTRVDSQAETRLMERYFARQGKFKPLRDLPAGDCPAPLQVYVAKFHKDKPLLRPHRVPDWVTSLQVGRALTGVQVAELADNSGSNISSKNGNYCELTALYWIWKNVLKEASESDCGYCGLYHYRRFLDVTEEDLYRLEANHVDAVLPFPTLHEPDISEHHARYLAESDWEAMKQALSELHPEYAEAFPVIFAQDYLYNYNIILAKRQVLADYCAWLFPILERTEELSSPKGWERSDRYMGYLGENLLTLYFLFHRNDLNIYHSGRLMLT